MRIPHAPLALLVAGLACLTSCTAEHGTADDTTAARASASTSGGGAPSASSVRPDAEAPEVQRAPGAPLVFTAQQGWVEETPTSSMRKAQYLLPRAEGDAQDASLVVYFFPTGAGTLQANLERWAGQFEQPDGTPSKDAMTRIEHKVQGMPVHEVALSGTYVAETAPGSGQRVREEGWRMLVSVIDSDHGSYYAKLVGPERTVTRWEPSFRRFIGDVR